MWAEELTVGDYRFIIEENAGDFSIEGDDSPVCIQICIDHSDYKSSPQSVVFVEPKA